MAKNRDREMSTSFDMGRRLDTLLKIRGWTARDLAALIGETETTVKHYINGTRTPKATVALDIAKALSISLDSLYGNHCLGFYDLLDYVRIIKADLTEDQKLELVRVITE